MIQAVKQTYIRLSGSTYRYQRASGFSEINQQLRIASEENLPEASVPYELSKDEIDLLYEERDQLIKKLDEDAGLAA